jgi:dethiobiotin synthetase
MRGLFVTGTDTGVGKSVLSAAIVAALVAGGEDVCPLKPLLTGLEEAPDPVWPPDDALLALAGGVAPEEVTIETFGPPVSPHLAAELAGREIDVGAVVAEIRRRAGARVAIVEGVGGLLVPLGADRDVRDLAVALELPVVIAARPGLGTISHTRLTVELARAAGLHVVGIVLGPWSEDPSEMERSNRQTIAAWCELPVATLPFVHAPTPAALSAAGAELPLADWLG